MTTNVIPQGEAVMHRKRGAGETERPGVHLLGGDGHVRTLQDIEAEVIYLAISKYGGSVSQAAFHLRMGRSTLYRKLQELEAFATLQRSS